MIHILPFRHSGLNPNVDLRPDLAACQAFWISGIQECTYSYLHGVNMRPMCQVSLLPICCKHARQAALQHLGSQFSVVSEYSH